jgi:hypothetical protein
MRAPNQDQEVPTVKEGVHWSVDFVEHLRTVHFALVALALTLIVVATSTRERESKAALAEISQIVAACNNWQTDWVSMFSNHYEFSLRRGASEDESEIYPSPEYDKGSWKIEDKTEVLVNVQTHDIPTLSLHPYKATTLVKLHFPAHNWKFYGDYRSLSEAEVLPEQAPGTLDQFRRWWDALDSVIVFVPTHIARRASLPSEGARSGEKSFEFTEATSGKPDFDVNLEFDTVTENLGYSNRSRRENRGDLQFSTRRRHFYRGEIQLPNASGSTKFVIPVRVRSFSHPNGLAASFGRRRGPFADAFGALDRATRGLGVLDLKTISDHLLQAAGHEEDVFEAFGVKFPANQVTQWGILLLLCVQLYLWVHIYEVRGKLQPQDPGWDVAWIGVYQSSVSKMMFRVSMLVPGLSVGILSARIAASFDERTSLASRKAIIGLVATLTSLGIAWFTLKHMPGGGPSRPRLNSMQDEGSFLTRLFAAFFLLLRRGGKKKQSRL